MWIAFEKNCTNDVVSSVNTSFYVDHTEPLEALEYIRHEWFSGEPLEGHEFLCRLGKYSKLLTPARLSLAMVGVKVVALSFELDRTHSELM